MALEPRGSSKVTLQCTSTSHCLCFSLPQAFANAFPDTNFDTSGRNKPALAHIAPPKAGDADQARPIPHPPAPQILHATAPSALMPTSCLTQESGCALTLTRTFLFRCRQTGAAPLTDLRIVSAYPAGTVSCVVSRIRSKSYPAVRLQPSPI